MIDIPSLSAPYYSAAEVAASVRRSERTIQRWIARGLLRARRIAGRVVVERAEVERLLHGTPIDN